LPREGDDGTVQQRRGAPNPFQESSHVHLTAGQSLLVPGVSVPAGPLMPEVTGGPETQSASRLPVLDSGAFRALAEQAGAPVAEKFLDDYLSLLPLRSAAVVEGLASEDLEKALDALISLKVSSAIAGASQIEDSARELQYQVQSGCWPHARTTRNLLAKQVMQVAGAALRQRHKTERHGQAMKLRPS
jgi:hypothetical protein